MLLAFVGGLILNLMPCVLPVISLKVLSFVRQGEREAREARGTGCSSRSASWSSFWIIAGVLVALRAGGRLLGWGFQFQDPAVVMVTAVLFFLIGLNLFGVFEIGSALTRLGARWAAASRRKRRATASFLFQRDVRHRGGDTLHGALHGRGRRVRALPFRRRLVRRVHRAWPSAWPRRILLLSVVPGLVSAACRSPGPWMETFRQVMAFPMMAAAVWMASVLAALAGLRR